MNPMNKRAKFGVNLVTYAGGGDMTYDDPFYENIDWQTTVNLTNTIESLQYDSMWICDHFMFGKHDAIFECWTSLSYLAALTHSIKLGTWVLCNSYRNPALVAKMASTLEIASGGRLYLGIGAGWNEKEYRAYGYRFLPPRERIQALRESLRIIKSLWTEPKVTYGGNYSSTNEATCNPKPTRAPVIMVGCFGNKMLRLTSELADAWCIAGSAGSYEDPSPEIFRERSNYIDKCCMELGRNPNEIERITQGHVLLDTDVNRYKKRTEDYKNRIAQAIDSGQMPKVDIDRMVESFIHGSSSECITQMNDLIDAGAEHFILYFVDFPDSRMMELFAKYVIPNVKPIQSK